ncbi:MAG: hypothetical protein E7037_02350 [Verrucomicrobia bacterium]|nr:hypothetical protein [Verrucomicrobiota bacterium]
MGEELKMFGFSTGETAPAIKYRTDIDKYAGSCRRLRNFDIDVTGAIVRRKGAEPLSEFLLEKDYPVVFFYSGTFIGEKVLILFYASDGNLYASYSRLEAEDKRFVAAGSVGGVDMGVLKKENVRVRQYNDVLFLCGDGLPVCQVKFVSFESPTRPQTITVYEEREEDSSKPKTKTATLVDALTGEYEWTYSVLDTFNNPDLETTAIEGLVSDANYYVTSLTTMNGAKPQVVESGENFLIRFGYSSQIFPYQVMAPFEEDYSYRSVLNVRYPKALFSGHALSKFDFVGVPSNDEVSPFGLLKGLEVSLTGLTLPDGCYSFDVTLKAELTTKNVSTGETGPYSETLELGTYHFENLTYNTVRTARQRFDNAEGGVVLSAFPWTIPPLVGFVPMDGGEFSVKDNTIFYPAATAVYDEKISFSLVKASEMLALENTSGEEIVQDWGKHGTPDAKPEGAVSDVYYASGNTTLYFFSAGGRWTGQLALQLSYDTPDVADEDCSWIDVGYITAAADGTLSPAVTFKVNHYNARVRVKLLSRSAASHFYYTEGDSPGAKSYSADMGCKWTLRITGDRRFYFSKESGGSDTQATVRRLNVSPKEFSCSRYSVGAFRKETGYPLTMDIAQQRLWFFSTATYPKYFWASKVDDIANFSTGTEKDDGLCFEADSGTPDFARWLKYGKGQFQFGCTQSEGNLVGKDNQYSLNPTSLALENESAWGSANADACSLGDKIFYIKAGSKIVHAQVYDSGRARYVSGEVNVLARHLFSGMQRAVKLVGLRAPDTVLFVLRADGSLARFVFNDEQNVGAWSTYDFAKEGLKAVDLGVIYGDASDTLVVMFEQILQDGAKRLVFAGIDSGSDVFTDFGNTDYESEVLTNALPLDGENSYGGRGIIGKLDLYGCAGTDCAFDVSFDGGKSFREQYKGITGEGQFSPVAGCRRISWSGGYVQEAVVGVRTKCRGEFSLLAIGAYIRRSDTPHPPARERNGTPIVF